jgi:hypothetical protein
MMGTTAQMAALVCHFNARQKGVRSHFSDSHSTTKFCEHVHFLKRGDIFPDTWNIIARTPEDWINCESRPGLQAWLLHRTTDSSGLSDRMSAGFIGGGGEWSIALAKDHFAHLWASNWQVGDRQSASDQKVWRVQYANLASISSFSRPEGRPIESIHSALNALLQEIESFAAHQQLNGFANAFASARNCLVAPDPLSLVFHNDLVPDGAISLAGRQLLAAAQAAWVFGGMGSWNDQGFEGADGTEYERLSDTLFALLNESICAATNSMNAGVA